MTGITALIALVIIPAVEKANSDAVYVGLGGFAETKDQLDPRVASMYGSLNMALENSSEEVLGVSMLPFATSTQEETTQAPQPSDEVLFGLTERVFFSTPETTEKAYQAFKQTYLAQGYKLERDGDVREFPNGKSQGATFSKSPNDVSAFSRLTITYYTNVDDPASNSLWISDSVNNVPLSGVPVLAGSITQGDAAKVELSPSLDCSLTTPDGMTMPEFQDAWLEGYGCVKQ